MRSAMVAGCRSKVEDRTHKELKGFKKVYLCPEERQTVEREITPELLAFYDVNMNYVVEPGEFAILVGSSSRDADLRKVTLLVKE
jgi:beta-glucosidase